MEDGFNLHQQLVGSGRYELSSFSRTSGYDASSFSDVSVTIPGGNCGEEAVMGKEIIEDEETMKSRIASHPLYPRLLNNYIDCQKMGAPDEITSLLEEISVGSNMERTQAAPNIPEADPELDLFMGVYCETLAKYRSDLARPLYEATSFFNTVEKQMSHIRDNSAISSAEPLRSSEESAGGEAVDGKSTGRSEGRDMKDELLRRYSGYLGSLKQDFSKKKKKKGNLPKEARQILLDWWNLHYKWPYPTDAEKMALGELTGLSQKQINNWFINQRKRRWKPSESMKFAVLDSLSSSYLHAPR